MKDTYYFPHDYNARGDEKITHLLSVMGWEGYGLYWAIIEKLYEAGGYLEKNYGSIAFDLRTQSERIEQVIEEFGLFHFSTKKFFSRSALARLRQRKGKTEKARQSARLRWDKQNSGDANALPTHSEGNARKESKVKESKYITQHQKTLTELIEPYRGEYAPSMIEDFLLHFDEPDKKGIPLWKTKKTWDTSMRLKRWKRTSEGWQRQKSDRFVKVEEKEEIRKEWQAPI